jgi:hypothetical protein
MKFFGVDVVETRGPVTYVHPFGGEPMQGEGIILSALPEVGRSEPIRIPLGVESGQLIRGFAAGLIAARVLLREWIDTISQHN